MNVRTLFLGTLAPLPVLLSAQLTVNNTLTPAQLVQDVLLGQGVSAFNISYNGVLNPGTPQFGTGDFTVINSDLDLAAGVILSSGDATNIDQPASSIISDITTNTGDADLLELALASDPDVFSVNDYAILEFDFIPTGDSLKFNFIFGSEEYPEFVCAYNDVFGFFLSGPGITGPFTNNAANIALIPNTTQAITINNVNNGYNNNPNDPTCPAMNPEYYIDNSASTTVVFDGRTTVIEARAQVICGETYHIKLAIADVNDHGVDSGVFLEAGSFTSTGSVIPELSTAGNVSANDSTMFEGCGLIPFEFHRLGDTSNVDTVDVVIGGTATGGADYFPAFPAQLIYQPGDTLIPWPVNVPLDADGLETITITITQNIVCSGTQVVNEYTFYIDQYNPLQSETTDVEGDCGGQYTLTPVITGGTSEKQIAWDTGEETWSIDVAPGFTTTYYFTVTDTCGVLPVSDSITVTIPVYPALEMEVSPLTLIDCLGNGDIGVTSIAGGDGTYSYGWTLSGANAGVTQTINVPAAFPHVYYVATVTDGCGSTVSDSVEVGTVPLDNIVIDAPDRTVICLGDTTTLEVLGVTGGNGVYTYAWTNSQQQTVSSLPSVEVGVAADAVYLITVTDQCGNEGSEEVYSLIPHPAPFTVNLTRDTVLCLGDSLTLWAQVSGGSGYYTVEWVDQDWSDPQLGVSPPVNAQYRVNIYDQCGEAISADVNVGVEQPVVEIQATNAGQDDWVFEAATLPTFCRSYRWDLGDGTVSRERTLAHSYLDLEEHWVKLEVVTPVGCAAVDSVLIRPPGQLFFPNAFTPDGDGINEVFGPGTRYIEQFEMTIYDRWGQQVYATEDVNKPWDGKVNGADVVTGVYVYKFKAAGHLFPSTEGYGHVTLLSGSDAE